MSILFSSEELQNGLIIENEASISKRIPLDMERVEILKSLLIFIL